MATSSTERKMSAQHTFDLLVIHFFSETCKVVILLRPTMAERPLSDASGNLGKPFLLRFSPRAGRCVASGDCWTGKFAHIAILRQSGREAMLVLELGVVSGNFEREASLVRQASDASVGGLVLVGEILCDLL